MKIKYNFHISNTRYQKTERMFDVSESVVTWAQPYRVGKQNTLLWEFILNH